MATILLFSIMAYNFFVIANIAAFGIGCYLIGITTTREIKSILYIADKRLKLKKERLLAMKRFKELIEWHAMVKQLSKS